MRKYLYVTMGRRQGISFPIKTSGYQVIGTMVLNVSKSRHEMELTEEEFLRYQPDIAKLCQRPETAIYVAEVRDDGMNAEEMALANKLKEREARRAVNPEAHDEFHGIPFFALRKMARDLGVDVTLLTGAEAVKAAIREARLFAAA